MNDIKSLSHTKWECKYHLTWIPKYREKEIYGDSRAHLGEVLRELARRAGCEILEGHLLPDHRHMLISIPPKYPVSNVVGYIKGKVQFILRGHILVARRISRGNIFGLKVIMYQQ